ncbi:MAG: hypothetical protein V1821_00120 [bacterium]
MSMPAKGAPQKGVEKKIGKWLEAQFVDGLRERSYLVETSWYLDRKRMVDFVVRGRGSQCFDRPVLVQLTMLDKKPEELAEFLTSQIWPSEQRLYCRVVGWPGSSPRSYRIPEILDTFEKLMMEMVNNREAGPRLAAYIEISMYGGWRSYDPVEVIRDLTGCLKTGTISSVCRHSVFIESGGVRYRAATGHLHFELLRDYKRCLKGEIDIVGRKVVILSQERRANSRCATKVRYFQEPSAVLS